LKILTETLFKMLVGAFRKPPVILKSNTVIRFKNFLNFPPLSAANGTISRIYGITFHNHRGLPECHTEHSKEGPVALFRKHRQVSDALF
jgi:hypothetical protein